MRGSTASLTSLHLTIQNKEYENDLLELVRLFEPRYEGDLNIVLDYKYENGMLRTEFKSDFFENFKKVYTYKIEGNDEIEIKRNIKIYLKVAIYNVLAYLTRINLPYGCLTGIRPTKLYRDLGKSARDTFTNVFSVIDKKVDLVKSIVDIQNPILSKKDEYDIFIFIPFCPSKCKYCTFVSEPLERTKHLVDPYVSCLIRELSLLPEIIKKNRGNVRSIYIGGGTPTALPINQLQQIIRALPKEHQEFTVEAGRPETITEEMLSMLSEEGVNRISINPQTFNDRTLKTIGRLHNSYDIDRAYKLARDKFLINMDLIAMLPEETFYDFKYSLDKTIYYNPDNITIHTLYKKRASEIEGRMSLEDDNLANKMIDYSQCTLNRAEYIPYYMYRQKYTGGSLENVGYAKVGTECLYNIDIMEEQTNIIAFGAGAISKRIHFDKNLITRLPHAKNPYDYINRIDEIYNNQQTYWLNLSD